MAQTIQVTDIMEACRTRCDLDPFTSDTHVTSTEIVDLIALAAEDLSGFLHNAWGSDYFTTSTTLSTVADTSTVNLPSNAFHIQNVGWVRSNGVTEPLDRASQEQMIQLGGQTGGWSGCTPVYRAIGSSLEFYPTPASVETIKLFYTSGIHITSSGDSFDGQLNWREYIVLATCARIEQAQDRDDSQFLRALAIIKADIKAQAPRNKRARRQVRDVDSDGLDYIFRRRTGY